MRDEVFNDCLATQAKMSGTNKAFWPGLSEKWGYNTPEQLRGAFKREKKKRGMNNSNSQERTTYEQGDDYINIVCSSRRIKTKEDVIKEFDIDMTKWICEKFIVRTDEAWRKDRKVRWEVEDGKVLKGSVDDSGKILLVPLTRVEVRFVPLTVDNISLSDIEDMFKKKKFIPRFSISKPKLKKSDEVLEIDVCDLHFGSDANDHPEERFETAIGDVIGRIGNRSFDKIYFPLLADIFHYDNMQKATTSGTLVSTDGLSPYDIFDLGIDSFIRVIGGLSEIAPVEVLYVAGNHDRLSGYHLVKTLEAFFKDEKHITFDAEHKSRKHRVIGNSLVGWMHGDVPKARAMSWLQVDAREDWGKTKYSEIHSGNFHSQSGKEDGGTVLRYLPAMTNIDQWHYDKAYVGAVRAMVSFVWHKELGLREIWYSNV